MKIVMVSEFYYPDPGGVGEHIRALSVELERRGHDVVVITGGNGSHGGSQERGRRSRIGFQNDPVHAGTETSAPGPRVVRIGRGVPVPYNGSLSRITVGWTLGKELRSALREERPDLLHIHNPLMPSLPLWALHQARCPVVATFHSSYDRDRLVDIVRPAMRRLARKIRIGVPVSLSAARSAGSLLPSDHHIVPNGVDLSLFRPVKPREGPARRILFVGAMVPRKGLPVLLEAFARLKQMRRELELIVVGDGPLRRTISRQISSSIRHSVLWRGALGRTDLPRAYAEADLFCAPSLGRESFGMVLLEAMASGLPVVASSIEGYRLVIDHGRDGLLVPPGDPDALAAALLRLLDSPQERADLTAAGCRKAARHGWAEIARRLDQIYRSALDLPSSDPSDRVAIPAGIGSGNWTDPRDLPISTVVGAREPLSPENDQIGTESQ